MKPRVARFLSMVDRRIHIDYHKKGHILSRTEGVLFPFVVPWSFRGPGFRCRNGPARCGKAAVEKLFNVTVDSVGTAETVISDPSKRSATASENATVVNYIIS